MKAPDVPDIEHTADRPRENGSRGTWRYSVLTTPRRDLKRLVGSREPDLHHTF